MVGLYIQANDKFKHPNL